MIGGDPWPWLILFSLGTYHGINPGMGWLFAVALGMQERDRRAVWRALLPITAGHAVAVGAVLLLALLAGALLPLARLKYVVAAILIALGVYRLARQRHPRYGGMQVGFLDLTVWSFLMATAHGAGLMVVPVFLGMTDAPHGAGHDHAGTAGSLLAGAGPMTGLAATAVHTLGYLIVTGVVAVIVYEKLGVALLRRAWVNLDRIWAFALIGTGVFSLFL